jgi:tripartite-type tricarboxylate transporter receptor subunit TctC
VFLPAGTPEPIVLKLNKAIGEILRSAEFKQKAGPAAEQSPGTPQQLDAFVRSEIEKWKRVVAQAKLEVE